MVCFGMTDYRRPAEVAVVFGARVRASGRPSEAVTDRVLTACALYRAGLVQTLLMSGGPGDGAIHETEAMRTVAIAHGVPARAIWLDRHGLDTQATVRQTVALCQARGVQRILAVSHFYHLPRVKLTYRRAGWDVATVPADERGAYMRKLPLFMAREVVALWGYYLRPLWEPADGGRGKGDG
jgi:vancomycin permeability regulator SanA